MDSVSEHKGSECRQHVDQHNCSKPQDQSAVHLCLCSRTTQRKWFIEKPPFFFPDMAPERCLNMVIRSWENQTCSDAFSSPKDAEKISHTQHLWDPSSHAFPLWPSSGSSDLAVLLNIPLHLFFLQNSPLSLFSFLPEVPGEEATGDTVCMAQPCWVLSWDSHCCQLHIFLSQRPSGSFLTKILPHATATTLPQWLFLTGLSSSTQVL